MSADGLELVFYAMWAFGLVALLLFVPVCLVLVYSLQPWSWLLVGLCTCWAMSEWKLYFSSLLVIAVALGLMTVCSSPAFLCIGLVYIAVALRMEKRNSQTFTKQYGSASSFIRQQMKPMLIAAASWGAIRLLMDTDPDSWQSADRAFIMFAIGWFAYGASSGHVGEAVEIFCESLSSCLTTSPVPVPSVAPGAMVEQEGLLPQRTGVCRVIAVDASVKTNMKSCQITGTNLGGECVASFNASRNITLRELHETFASRLSVRCDELKLVSDARCLTNLPGNRLLTSVIDMPGMILKSKRAKQRK